MDRASPPENRIYTPLEVSTEIKLVADIHGEIDALREALRPDDTMVILGDPLNLMDFRSLDGIPGRHTR